MPDIPDAMRAGLEHHRAGRLVEAEKMYRQVLEIHPRHAQAIHLLGLIAYQIGKHDTAVQYLTEAIKIDAFHAPYPADLAEIYRSLGKIPEATAAYRKAIELNPEMPETQYNLGMLLEAEGQRDEAAECFREAVRYNPTFTEAYQRLGSLLLAAGEWSEAGEVFLRLVRLAPEEVTAHLNLAKCQRAQGDWSGALQSYDSALRLQPDLVEVHHAAAQARLAVGEFAEGWRQFEARTQCPGAAPLAIPPPLWSGAPLQAHRVLVKADGCLSDTLQFIRFVPQVAERGGTAVLDVQPALVPLLEQSGYENLARPEAPPEPCQLQVALLSLPGVLGTTLETIPAGAGYLQARPRLVAQWGQKLSELSGCKVGIAWQGDPRYELDRFRSLPLAEFQPLADVSGVRLISLQKKDGLDQLASLGGRFEVIDFGPDVDQAPGAFMDTAAIMANLDLVVTCDTAAAHLAGALGVPVWVVLSPAADWRWMQDRADSPWYPTMRLFRRAAGGTWADLMRQVAAELVELVASRSAGAP